LKKKNQKTFIPLRKLPASLATNKQKSFASFLQKRRPYFLPHPSFTITCRATV
jgi:hypothetical protein